MLETAFGTESAVECVLVPRIARSIVVHTVEKVVTRVGT